MGSHKKETQLKCALVCGSSGAGGWALQMSEEQESLALPTWPVGAVILELHVAGSHIHHCCQRMSKPGTFYMQNYLNGSICQFSHVVV